MQNAFINTVIIIIIIIIMKEHIPPATYEVISLTIATDFHQTCIKMCLRDMRIATENSRCRRYFVSSLSPVRPRVMRNDHWLIKFS